MAVCVSFCRCATDIRIDNPDEAICLESEIDYFHGFTTQALPEITVDRSQIIYHFSGVRPLPYTDAGFTGSITREHGIQVVAPDNEIHFPIYSLVGGKWTTFRAFAEQTTDQVLGFLGRSRRVTTLNIPIGGGRDYPPSADQRNHWIDRIGAKIGLASERLESLFERYGTRAEQVATFIAEAEDTLLADVAEYSRREIMFIVQHEKVIHLDDVLLRRTSLALLGQLNVAALEQLGEVVGTVLGWSETQIRQEVIRAADLLKHRHGVPASRLLLASSVAGV